MDIENRLTYSSGIGVQGVDMYGLSLDGQDVIVKASGECVPSWSTEAQTTDSENA